MCLYGDKYCCVRGIVAATARARAAIWLVFAANARNRPFIAMDCGRPTENPNADRRREIKKLLTHYEFFTWRDRLRARLAGAVLSVRQIVARASAGTALVVRLRRAGDVDRHARRRQSATAIQSSKPAQAGAM